MAGYVNSWIETYTNQPSTCAVTQQSATSSDWMLWILVGLIIGSLQFEKKHDATKS